MLPVFRYDFVAQLALLETPNQIPQIEPGKNEVTRASWWIFALGYHRIIRQTQIKLFIP